MSSSADLEKIYDAITAKKIKAYAECDLDGCASMYANHAVIMNKPLNKTACGLEDIKKAIKDCFEYGPCSDFKFTRKEIYGLGKDRKIRFYVNGSFACTTMKSTSEGDFEQLFEKVNGEWKCIYDRNM